MTRSDPTHETSTSFALGLIVLWAVSAPVLCLLYMMIEPSPDQMQFDYMAWLALQGAPYYAGSFDMNWPGAMLLHELGIRLFGVQSWTWHLTDFLIMQVLTMLIAWALLLMRLPRAALIFLALYPAAYVTAGGWIAGQRDIIAGGLVTAACAFVLVRRDRFAGLTMAAAGALIGYAVLIRPTFLLFAAIVAGLELAGLGARGRPIGARLARVLFLSAGGVAVFAIVAALALAAGNLDDWYQLSIRFALSVYAGNPPQDVLGNLGLAFFNQWLWMTLGAMIGLAVWLVHRGADYPLALIAGAAVTTLVSYFFQNKGFIYHLGGLVPLMVLLSAAGIDLLWQRSRDASLLGTGAKLLCALTVLGCSLGAGKKLYNERTGLFTLLRERTIQPLAPYTQRSREETAVLVEAIRSGSGPGDSVVQYGTAYNIPFLAERQTSHRFINNVIEDMPQDFAYRDVWLDEIHQGLASSPPVFVLIASRGGQMPEPDLERPGLYALLEYMGDDYKTVHSDRFGVLLQRTGAP